MKKKHWVVRILIIFALIIVLLAAASVGYGLIKQKTNSLSAIFNAKPGSTASASLDQSSKAILDQEQKQISMAQEIPQSPSPLASSSSPAPVAAPSAAAPGALDGSVLDILVLGVDSREFQKDSQTDSILLLRVDKNKKSIKIISIARDIYLSIPGFTDNRINEANVYGGPELVMKTLNQAFGLNIQKYVVFDFKTAEEMIDMMGKVTVSVEKDELAGINGNIDELNSISTTGKKADHIKNTGKQELTGRQAVAYARLRPNMGSDITRMGRQREILLSLLQLVRKMKADQVMPLANKAMEIFYTNLPITQFPSLAADMYGAKDYKIEQLAVPIKDTYKEVKIVEMKYLVIDFAKNKESLLAFLNS